MLGTPCSKKTARPKSWTGYFLFAVLKMRAKLTILNAALNMRSLSVWAGVMGY